jgi:hypothetical protein
MACYIGVAFERHLDAELSFRTGPLYNPSCRWQDYQDLKALISGPAEGR